MRLLDNLSIGVKLPLLTVLVGLIAIASAQLIANSHSREIILLSEKNRLESVAEARAADLRREVDMISADLIARSKDAITLAAIRAFKTSWLHMGDTALPLIQKAYVAENPYPAYLRQMLVQADDQSPYSYVHRRYHPFFNEHRASLDYADVMLVSPEGRVVYSTSKDANFGSDLGAEAVAATPLAHAFRTLQVGEPNGSPRYFGLAVEAPSGPEENGAGTAARTAIFATAIHSPLGNLEGVLIVRLSEQRFAEILTRNAQHDGVHLSLYADDGQQVLPRRDLRPLPAIPASGGRPGPGVIETPTEIVAAAPVEILRDAHRIVARKPLGMVLLPAAELRREMLKDGALALSVISLLGLVVARSMSVPLTRVGYAMFAVSRGDYGGEITDRDRKDEIGSIARRLDQFRASLVEAEGHARENAFKGTAFEESSAAMMLVDAQMTILYVNARMEALLQAHRIAFERLVPDFRAGGLQGRALTAIYPSADRARAALGSQKQFSDELRLGQSYLRIAMTLIRDDAGTGIGYVLEWTDVTSDHLNRLVLSTIDRHLPVASFSPDGRLIQANPLFEAWVLPETGSAGLTWRDFFRGSSADLLRDSAFAGVQDGNYVLDPVEGASRRVSLNGICDRAGKLQRYLLIAFEESMPVDEGQSAYPRLSTASK